MRTLIRRLIRKIIHHTKRCHIQALRDKREIEYQAQVMGLGA